MPQLTPPKSKPQFPPMPEFYGGELGPQVSPETATNQADWSGVPGTPVAPKPSPLFEAIMALLRHFNMGMTTKPKP